MGIIEEVGSSARAFMDDLKAQPLALALVIMNIGLMFLMYIIWNGSLQADNKQMEMIFQAQREMQILLSKCNMPDGAFHIPTSIADIVIAK